MKTRFYNKTSNKKDKTKKSKGKKRNGISYLPPKLESNILQIGKMQFGVLGSGFNEGILILEEVVLPLRGWLILDLAKSFLDNTPQVENLSLNGLVGATLGISFNDNTLQTFNKMNPRTFNLNIL